MRIEKETEVTIKVKIGYVYPDDFTDEFGEVYLSEEEFRNNPLVEDTFVAEEILSDSYGSYRDLFRAGEVTLTELGIVQE